MKLRTLILSLLLSCPVMLVAQGLDTAKIDEAMGRSGQKTGDVYRLGFPRTDLHVSIGGFEIKPGLALGSWAAFAGNDNDGMVMGDLVLLENELTPVMKKLRAAGFDITFIAPAALGDELVAEAVERARFGRSGLYDVTVTCRRGSRFAVIAEFRGRSRSLRGSPDGQLRSGIDGP